MKNKSIHLLFVSLLVFTSYTTQAQAYRAAATEALANNGKEWVEKKLPPSIITYADFSGQVEIKTIIASLAAQQDSSAAVPAGTDGYANFAMNLNRDQLPEQTATAKNFTTTGILSINNISKKITAQYILEPRNTGEGFTISVIMRFNPADFNLKLKDEPANEPLIVKVNAGYLNKTSNNF